ncbi:MAG: TetR/AcrR family transcriptional regulator [Archangiaceae bacterium]|nr:TetR/AcrR family transcriptional regulator [Archangiaceae bacterium]
MPARARRTYHHGDLRNAMLQKALELVDEHGPEAVSLREVARRVGVNHRAAYRHFDDKRALTAAIAEQGYLALAVALEVSWAKSEKKAPRARVVALMDAYLDFALESSARYRITFGKRVNEDDRYPVLEATAERGFAVLMRALGGMRATPASREQVRDLGFSLWSLAHGYLQLVWSKRIRVRPELTARYFHALAVPLLDGWETTKKGR